MLRLHWTSYLIGTLLVVSLASGWLAWRQHAEIALLAEQLKTAQAATTQLQATSVSRERKRAATARAEASEDARAAAAVASAPEWAAAPVPKEVADALAE
jgi:hypothetical protein